MVEITVSVELLVIAYSTIQVLSTLVSFAYTSWCLSEKIRHWLAKKSE